MIAWDLRNSHHRKLLSFLHVNINSQVPELATCLLISLFPQLPFILYLAYVQPVMFPVDTVLGTFMVIFLVREHLSDAKFYWHLDSSSDWKADFSNNEFMNSSRNSFSGLEQSGHKYAARLLNLWDFVKARMGMRISPINSMLLSITWKIAANIAASLRGDNITTIV